MYPLPNGQLTELADGLDVIAEVCRPSSDAFTNPAKALAAEFAEAIPVLAGAGALAGVAARLFADALHLLAGWPAVSVTLPDGLAAAVAMLPGQSQGADDFFRDRTEESGSRPARVVVIGDDGEAEDPALGSRSIAQLQLDEVASRRTASALHELAGRAGARSSTVDVPAGAALTRFAAATAFGMFTATYLALGLGIDPSGAYPGEPAR
jgi:glucose/mannose-6-phosphate isomerase